MNSPVFSIIIPCYNQAHFLEECLFSVIAQTFFEWEAIIINDGSTDNTCEVAENLVSLDSRIILINQTNQGLSEARNKGLTLAKGEILSFLDSDDILYPSALEIIHRYFDQKNVDLIIGGYTYFTSVGDLHTNFFLERKVAHLEIRNRNFAPPVSHFLKKVLAAKIGKFDKNLKSCEDWDYWIRVGKIGGNISTITEVIGGYRYDLNSMSRNPEVMYKSLTEVSRRAGKIDLRLSDEAIYNDEVQLDYPEIQKGHLISVIGIMLQKGYVLESVEWYCVEAEKWKWSLVEKDWKYLSSSLSWAYFFEKEELINLLPQLAIRLNLFFSSLGYEPKKVKKLIKDVLSPQLKRINHYRFGKYLGAIINRIEFQ